LRYANNPKNPAQTMPARLDEVMALRGQQPLPAHRVIQLRSNGMHAVRMEFVIRLLRAALKVDTLSIYWERAHEFMLRREVEDVERRLIFGRRRRVIGNFRDLWILCYPDDAELRQSVESEIDRMVEEVRHILSETTV
jgi:hypothetical protein